VVVSLSLRLLIVLLVAGVLAAPSSSAAPTGGLRSVAFIAVFGHGTVTSVPSGIKCPGTCRAIFPTHAHISLHAMPARGWAFTHFSGSCKSKHPICGFNLISSHDCIGGACPIGAFGVRLFFVRQPST
jgi:hypothetical protein